MSKDHGSDCESSTFTIRPGSFPNVHILNNDVFHIKNVVKEKDSIFINNSNLLMVSKLVIEGLPIKNKTSVTLTYIIISKYLC
jgi:hypothetical protein